jgi:hypothetical protein
MIAIRGLLLVGDFSTTILTGGCVLRESAVTRAAARIYRFAERYSFASPLVGPNAAWATEGEADQRFASPLICPSSVAAFYANLVVRRYGDA